MKIMQTVTTQPCLSSITDQYCIKNKYENTQEFIYSNRFNG